ncbi:hypothetical protein [Flavobacterium cellulosilyticum]|uniref:Uncharacterized protein n=1 Tax=Flavobacterium cellulosilyticum TaxID=2541731 RepID=A0A4R5CFP7_9FLAO|nr:hypothetical protein [Flavobacterium cellulosilyticum]TDD98435.1 hypothetical protein E0F76_04675 [Flavobacterium cellulosilyticum]
MKTEKEINEAIFKITLKIKEQFPELSKYIEEMPITVPINEDPQINSKTLLEYYNSLNIMLKDYSENNNIKPK